MRNNYTCQKSRPRQERRGWWFVIASFSAAFLYIYYFNNYYHHFITTRNTTATPIVTHKQATQKPADEFDFYSMLPKIQVQVKNAGIPNAPQLTSGQIYYVLQVATPGNNAAAQDEVTKLGVMGVNAYVKPDQRPDGKILYRILVGPYTSQSDADTDRAYLKTNGITSLFLSAKAP